MQGPEDGNEDDQESVSYFLVNKTFNLSVVFIYISFMILVLILSLRSPSVCVQVFFAVSVTNLLLISLGYRRYPFRALHPQASA